ncbi:HTH-type transcriptional regulator SrpR [bacterium YEK0313]|nr:HTH-type transcriptional regulator SrpR [bacterium YEK0313]
MAQQGEPAAGRKPRADAARNHARLLATAKAVFAAKGSNASLDEIARIAGVGAGTLYRHFPNRDALVAAVFRNDTEQLVAAADRLADMHPPLPALREWLLVFVDFVTAKQGMQELLEPVLVGMSELKSESSARMKQAASKLVDAAVASGDIRPGLDPLDLPLALVGVAKFSPDGDGAPAARRLVDILIAGVRAPR